MRFSFFTVFLNNSIQEIKMVLIEVKITPKKTPDNIHLRNIKRNQKRSNERLNLMVFSPELFGKTGAVFIIFMLFLTVFF